MSNTKIERKNFISPDEMLVFNKAKVEHVKIGGYTVSRLTLNPGWKWSTDSKPIAKTDSCQFPHIGIILSGRIMLSMDDGTEIEYGPNDIASIPSGHNAWTVGNEPVVFIEWEKTPTT